jgi:hypothetical protein
MTASMMKLTRARVVVLAAIGLGAIMLSACGDDLSSTPASGTTSSSTASLFVEVDQVSVATATSCWVMSSYRRGDGVFFRAKVFDPSTGKPMVKEDLQSVLVALPNGQSLPATFGGHPSKSPTDSFWGILWKIPADYPTGTVAYTVTATANDGRRGQYIDFNVATSLLTVVE